MSAIRWLGDDDCHSAAYVGGKAASLSRLVTLHTVPGGFAVPALAATTLALPPDVAAAVAEGYRTLGQRRGIAELPVAVRSSAIDEDGSETSFAGQHDTYLNIHGGDAVVDAVHRCVRSAASDEALAYRKQRGLSLDDLRVAVLVQELVPSDVSAVAFSANPLTGARDELMITASWGLGESIVGGTVTPDTFVVSKPDAAISWRDIAQKERMTVLAEHGTAETDVPADLQGRPSLTDEQVLRIADLASRLEAAAGHPVDVECAFAADTLYLLQCRPITTL